MTALDCTVDNLIFKVNKYCLTGTLDHIQAAKSSTPKGLNKTLHI